MNRIELAPEKMHGAKVHAAFTYRIPDTRRGRLFWKLLDLLLRFGGAE
jgi:hypothetical protein